MRTRFPRTLLCICLCLFAFASCSDPAPAPSEVAATPPDEQAAAAALKEIHHAQEDYIRRTRRYAQFTSELIAEKLLTTEPAAKGYTILMLPSPDAGSFTVQATPADATARHLFTD